MRILHVTDCYLPRLGGIELHVRDLASRQAAAGHDVRIVTRTPGDDEPMVRRLDGGARVWWAAEAHRSPDVVHAHVSVVSPLATTTARRAAYDGCPTLVTVHSLWPGSDLLGGTARGLLGLRRWPVTWSAVSTCAADAVARVVGSPVHVLPNAVDVDAWRPEHGLPDGPPRVLSVMRLTATKRAVPLVRVLRSVADRVELRATIVGDGPERRAVERLLGRSGLDDRVQLTGSVDRVAVRRHLAASSVFLAPAHRESFGIAALEARAAGLPVVASSRSGVPTFVEHGHEGLLAVDDRGLADHVVRLLRDHELRERIAAHNRAVAPAYDWGTALARNEELYELAADPVRGRVRARAGLGAGRVVLG